MATEARDIGRPCLVSRLIAELGPIAILFVESLAA